MKAAIKQSVRDQIEMIFGETTRTRIEGAVGLAVGWVWLFEMFVGF